MKKFLSLALVLLLLACGSKVDGTYADKAGLISYTFKSNGKVSQTSMGMTIEMNYEVEGDKIKLMAAQGVSIVMTLKEDGSIEGPLGNLTKQKK